MIKYLSISFHSFKQSVLHKPVALAMFILLIIMATVACGFSSRLMISEAESEIYPEIARIWCDEDADYVAIGDYMRSIENKYFNDYNDHGNILTRAIDIPVTFNEKSIIADVIELTFEVFNDKLSDKTIENGQKVMYANSNFCNLLGCEYGDNVTFCGEEILIIGVENSDEYDHMKRITMPYTIDLQKNISHSGGNPEDTSALKRQARLKIERLDFYGLQKNFDKGVYNDLKEIGVSPRSKSVNNALIQTVIMLVAFLIASSLSVISVTNYWQSVNAYKYNIYKTIGASPRRVAGIMLFETGIIASLAVAVGLLVDYIISLFVNIGAISRLLWLHYLVLFVATLLAVMVMVTIKIVRSAKRLPKEQLTSRRKRREKKMKKIKLFLYNIKNSWVFLGVIFVELVLCMILLSIAMTNFLGVNNQFAYFNKKVADNPFVTFDGYSLENDTTVSNISEYLSDDLSTLATAVNIGGVVSADIEYSTPYVTIATPALCQNFNNKGLKFSKDISDEYREAYVAEKYSSIYEKGEMYDIAVGSDDDICYSQKVKIKGYIEGQNYYAFSSGYIYFRPADIVICDKLPQFANLSSGIFVDGNSVDYYKDLGFKVTTVQKYYDMSKDSSPFTIYLYLAVIVILFTFVTILCNYVLSVDKLAKRNATMFVYGNTATAGIVNEGIKMLFAFLLAFATGIGIAELIVYLGVQRQNIMITMPHFYLSALIVLGVYVLAIVIGFIKFASAKPLKVINNMKDE